MVARLSDANLTRSLRDLAREAGIDLMGVAPVVRLEDGPKGARPTDYMPSARSVVVLAKKMPDAAVEVAGHYEEEGKTLGPYMWYGYVVLNWDLSSAAARVARSLEEGGFKALPFPPTGINYKFGTRADFSHRHAAVAAGLGQFGFSGLVLTPEFGPRQRLVSIITDAPLKPSPMHKEPLLCRPDRCGHACIKACPTKAMSGKVTLAIDGATSVYARLHPVRCKWPFPERGFRRTMVPMSPDPSEEDLRAAVSSTVLHPFDAALDQFTFVPQCGACIFSCPSPGFD
jgi:epoxyqueuosine reductase